MVTQGLPSAADLILMMDAFGSIVKGQYANIGIFGELETTTLAGLTRLARSKVMGDGTTTYVGLSNTDIQGLAATPLKQAVGLARYDSFFRIPYSTIFTQLDGLIKSNLPTGWNFSSSSGTRATDLWMTYLNACSSSVPATPSFTIGTPTATTGGAIGQSGAVLIKCCYQSSSGDWLVGLPTAASSTLTLSGKNNAITFTPSGNSTVTGYLLVFRTAMGGSTYYYDQRVAVTSGSAHPAITCTQSDQNLRYDINPPSFMQCMMLPEVAFLFANALAGPPQQPGAQVGLLSYPSQAFISPSNVTLNPSNGFLGVNNPAASAIFATYVKDTATFTAGTIQTANDATNVIQGFAGSASSGGTTGLQLRVTSVLNAGSVNPTVTYSYYDTSNLPSGSTASTTTAASGTLSTAVGSTIQIPVPTGRLVTAVTAVSLPTAATGTVIVESATFRTL